ncbi:UDP-N-acetylmuramoyl-L-alanine--D-glutamate ligase [Pelovirga terrestris]|uniref:UDP-N-acetylmuramoylalanine--D-glutamate ligase n=1 Tax=Pelovirga terrestris TaxID=2771352 RepID=A0A8J6QWS5_9BACT|nr:UDP-N-acetylmuramoyl-L-alanine--D-glutamate ligase [Pelovirga terrestris]MBD1400143.1 UDP-N-acetylmuramoyl-L-alanine--D-glutamate ligase [Pelovirga terrestris]
MKKNDQHQRVIVMGAGQSGQALVRFFVARDATVVLSDQRSLEQLGGLPALAGLPVHYDLGGHDPALFADADLIAVSPGVPLTNEALQHAIHCGVPVWGEIEIAAREINAPIIAVTGTNGKSTTTSLIGEVMQAWGKDVFVGGNLGTPFVSAALHPYQLAVVELSSFQLEAIDTFHPQIALLLNLSADHLDRYPDLPSYFAAKRNIFKNMKTTDLAVLNADDPAVAELCSDIQATKVWFSAAGKQVAGLTRQGHQLQWSWQGAQEVFALSALRLSGEHNVENAMAALTAALLHGCPGDLAWRTICDFGGLPHRMQLVRTLAGVKWYNDSKGTNVGSVMKSLAGLDRPVTLIAGGKDKGGDYAPLRPLLAEKVRHLILIGEARRKMNTELAGCCDIHCVDSMAEAVATAQRLTPEGGAVLLSPACSSFDMFAGYEQRGTVFTELVQALSSPGEVSR